MNEIGANILSTGLYVKRERKKRVDGQSIGLMRFSDYLTLILYDEGAR